MSNYPSHTILTVSGFLNESLSLPIINGRPFIRHSFHGIYLEIIAAFHPLTLTRTYSGSHPGLQVRKESISVFGIFTIRLHPSNAAPQRKEGRRGTFFLKKKEAKVRVHACTLQAPREAKTAPGYNAMT
jgi:hypothetical protein